MGSPGSATCRRHAGGTPQSQGQAPVCPRPQPTVHPGRSSGSQGRLLECAQFAGVPHGTRPLCVLDPWFTIKGHHSGAARGESRRARPGDGPQGSHARSGLPRARPAGVVGPWDVGLIKSGTSVPELTLQSLSPPRRCVRGWRRQPHPLITRSGPWQPAPPAGDSGALRKPPRSHTGSRLTRSSRRGRPEGCSSPAPRPRPRPNTHFSQ